MSCTVQAENNIENLNQWKMCHKCSNFSLVQIIFQWKSNFYWVSIPGRKTKSIGHLFRKKKILIGGKFAQSDGWSLSFLSSFPSLVLLLRNAKQRHSFPRLYLLHSSPRPTPIESPWVACTAPERGSPRGASLTNALLLLGWRALLLKSKTRSASSPRKALSHPR